MAYHLVVVSGREAGQRFPLASERYVLGRDAAADIRLDAIGASRSHCAICLRDGSTLTIEDLGSRNGTKVNGSLIDGNRTLRVGDRVAIGTTECLIADDRFHGQVRLQIIAGGDPGREIPLLGKAVTIGRGQAADVVIDDKAASRINCALVENDGVWQVEDRKSANGTLLNGDRIKSRQSLRSGDYLQIGATIFSFLDGRIEDLAGRSLGKYTLIRRVGSGSLGVVYEAKAQGSGQKVAVKIIDPSIANDASERARILNAARRASNLSDEHLVGVHACEQEEGLLYIASDWADNGSLNDLLDQSGAELPPSLIVAAMLLDAAKGLEAASRQNLHHNGLRPGNLLIFRDGVVRVSDFGTTARYQSEDHSAGGMYPYYVSPEELAAKPVDDLANQFSLGAVAYHALTGSPPFAEDDIASSASARLSSCLEHVRTFNSAVPAPLATIIARTLALSAEDRYPNWAALCKDLEAVIDQGERAKVTPVKSSAMAAESHSAAPRRSESMARGRGAAPRVRQVRSSNNQQRSIVIVAAIAAAFVVALLVVVSNIGSSSAVQDQPVAGSWRDEQRRESTPAVIQPPTTRQSTAQPSTEASRTLPPPPSQRDNDSATLPLTDHQRQGRDQVLDDEPIAAAVAPDSAASSDVDSPSTDDIAVASPPGAPLGETDPEPTAAPAPAPPPAPKPTGLPTRQGELTHFARRGTWEDGHLVLTDGSQSGSSIRYDGGSFTIRDTQGEEEIINTSYVAQVELSAPNSPRLRRGDGLLNRMDFANALAAYDDVEERFADHPYVAQQRHRARTALDKLTAAESNIINGQMSGDGSTVIEGIQSYIAIMEPRRLDAGYAQAWTEAWPQVAGRLDETERHAMMEQARQLGVRLSYDPQAPEQLKEAMAMVRSDSPDYRQAARLFSQAAAGNAYFDDDAKLGHARSLLATGNAREASRWLQRVSSSRRNSGEYQELSLALGLRPPPLQPELLVSTYVGGPGNQAIHEVSISGGVAVGKGTNFQVAYQLSSLRGVISGNPAHDEGDQRYSTQPFHPGQGQTFTDPRSGHTYRNRMRQVHSILQQPILTSSAGWTMWGQNYSDINPGTNSIRWGPLMADSRGYGVWMMPNGMIGASFWTDGGNSVLTRHPLDLSKANPIESMGAWQRHSSGMASLYLLIDPRGEKPEIKGGTFVPNHVTHNAVDPWGRVYLPVGVRSTDLRFGASAGRGGLFVLDPQLTKPELNIRFGGSGSEVLGRIAIEDNILVMGGRTQSKDLIVHNAVQERHGGGDWDGWLVIIRLWPRP
ncbi:MAG: FHA domain-containing protein [Planctomycetota bacterium]|nr:MAG: FHA domain-containing protein [Planctomycetota bacterium]